MQIISQDFKFWHGHCKIFCSVISFSVINYVVSMRCPRVSDDSSFFCVLRKKMSLSFLPPVRLCLTAPVGHTEPLITVRASPRLHCIPSLQRYGLSRIALCARIPVDYLCKLDAQKNELKLPTPSQALPDSPGGAYRTVNHGSGVSETPLHSVSPTLRLEPYCALRKNSSRLFMQTGRAKK